MAILELPNMPNDLLERIRQRAQSHGVSVEEQVVRDLAAIVPDTPDSRDAQEESLLAEIRKARDELAARGVGITRETIVEAKNWGRR